MGFAPGGFANTRLSGSRAFAENPFQDRDPGILAQRTHTVFRKAFVLH